MGVFLPSGPRRAARSVPQREPLLPPAARRPERSPARSSRGALPAADGAPPPSGPPAAPAPRRAATEARTAQKEQTSTVPHFPHPPSAPPPLVGRSAPSPPVEPTRVPQPRAPQDAREAAGSRGCPRVGVPAGAREKGGRVGASPARVQALGAPRSRGACLLPSLRAGAAGRRRGRGRPGLNPRGGRPEPLSSGPRLRSSFPCRRCPVVPGCHGDAYHGGGSGSEAQGQRPSPHALAVGSGQ